MAQFTRKQHGQGCSTVAKFFHHHETSEHHENLAPRAGQEGQDIVQPVTLPQYQPFMLNDFPWIMRIAGAGSDGNGNGQSTAYDIGQGIGKPQYFESKID